MAFLLTGIPLAITDDNIYLTVNNSILGLCMVVIFYCQVAVYCETRRHEKHIASQQVSAEARRKFLKAKKAFKVTTAVLLTLIMTYLPIFFVRILIKNFVVVTPVFFTATYIVMLNSLANPVFTVLEQGSFV